MLPECRGWVGGRFLMTKTTNIFFSFMEVHNEVGKVTRFETSSLIFYEEIGLKSPLHTIRVNKSSYSVFRRCVLINKFSLEFWSNTARRGLNWTNSRKLFQQRKLLSIFNSWTIFPITTSFLMHLKKNLVKTLRLALLMLRVIVKIMHTFRNLDAYNLHWKIEYRIRFESLVFHAPFPELDVEQSDLKTFNCHLLKNDK